MDVGFLNFKTSLEQQNIFFSDFTYGETPLPYGKDARFVQTWLHNASALNRAYFFKRHRLNTVENAPGVSKAYLVHLNTMVRRVRPLKNNQKRKQIRRSSYNQAAFRVFAMQNQNVFKTCLKRALKPVFRPKNFNAALKQFFNSNPLSQFLDQTNPLAELTHKRRLSFMGLGGLHKQNATMAARSIDPSHLGRLCPIETPEGQNAGLVHSLTCLTRMTHHASNRQKQLSRLAFPSIKNYVFPQTLLHVNHGDEKPMVHGGLKQDLFLSNALGKLGFLRQGGNKTWFQKPLSGSEFISVGALQNISLATCCIPFMEHNDGNRALMGSNMQRQALTLAAAQAPIVRTGWESQIHNDDSTEQAPQCGLVVRVESQNLILAHTTACEPGYDKAALLFDRFWRGPKTHAKPLPKRHLGFDFARTTGLNKHGSYVNGVLVCRNFSMWKQTNPFVFKTARVFHQTHNQLKSPFGIWFKQHRFTHYEQTGTKKGRDSTCPYGFWPYATRYENPVFSNKLAFGVFFGFCVESGGIKKSQTNVFGKPAGLKQHATKNPWQRSRSKTKVSLVEKQNLCKPMQVRSSFVFGKTTKNTPYANLKGHEGKFQTGFKRGKSRLRFSQTHLPGAYGGNQGTLRLHKPCLGFASWVQRGQALTNTACSQLGLLALGRNLLLGYTPWQGYNFEDAILINQSLVLGDVLTSLHVQSLVLKTQAPPKMILKTDVSESKPHKYQNVPDFETTVVGVRTQDHAWVRSQNNKLNCYDHHGVLKPGSNISPGVHLWAKGQTRLTRQKEAQTGSAGLLARLDLFEPKTPDQRVVDTSIKAGVNVCGRLLRVFKPKRHFSRSSSGKKPCLRRKVVQNKIWSWWLKPATLKLHKQSLTKNQTTMTQNHLNLIYQRCEENKMRFQKQRVAFGSVKKQKLTRRTTQNPFWYAWGVNSDLLQNKPGFIDGVFWAKPEKHRFQTRGFKKTRFLSTGFKKTKSRGKTLILPKTMFKPKSALIWQKRFDVPKQTQSLCSNVTKKTFKNQKRFAAKKTYGVGLPLRLRLTYVTPRRIQVGDKLSGRHGNKGIVSRVLPMGSMPYLPDGTPLDLALNPLGVPSRMNVGQLFECLLAFAGSLLKQNFRLTSFDERFGSEASRSLSYAKLYEARLKTAQAWVFNPNFPGKVRCFDGRSGQAFLQPLTVGKPYMLKLIHVVDDKIHARCAGPYSLVTEQPLRGRSKNGGQRVGEMEVWALQGYGAAHILHELLTLKSDSMLGRETVSEYLVFQTRLKFDLPESFKVLSHECQCLGLDLSLKANHHLCSQTFHPEKRWRLVKPNLSFKV